MSKAIVYVDLPHPERIIEEEGSWVSMCTFDTKEEAIEWIREHIDLNCDEEGRINLLSYGESQ